MTGQRTRFYRDKRNGKWAGVCAGFADYFGIDVTLVRLAFVLATVIGGWGMLVYLVIAWTAPVKPYSSTALAGAADGEEQKFWQEVRKNPHRSARTLRARFRELDRRLASVEAHLTSPDRRLAREIDSLR